MEIHVRLKTVIRGEHVLYTDPRTKSLFHIEIFISAGLEGEELAEINR